MNYRHLALICLLTSALCACIPEDRSGEQPFAPTVETRSARVSGNSCTVDAEVLSSPNSLLTGGGFTWGNDTLRSQIYIGETPDNYFSATIEDLEAGDYFVAAFATNGVGTSYGDTLTFTINP